MTYPELNDRVAIVTGAGQGLGKGIALRLAREGLNVVMVDINEQTVKQTSQEATHNGAKRTLPVTADISQTSQINAFVEDTFKVGNEGEGVAVTV